MSILLSSRLGAHIYYLSIILGIFAILLGQVGIANDNTIQYWRPNDQRGITIFETTKEDTIPFDGLRVRIGGANTMQFQALQAANRNNINIYELAPDFNLATSNLDLDVQLDKGLRMHMRVYLSSRNHPQPSLKGGYLQVDRLDFIKPGFMSEVMDKVTFIVGHMEVNYGDNHFRRSDNGQTICNPFVENYIMDAFTTEIGGEFRYQSNGLLAVLSVTNGKLEPTVVRSPGANVLTKPSLIMKAGIDKMLLEEFRLRITGSVYYSAESEKIYLYSGDRAGSRYYNVLTTNPREIIIPRFDPVFTNELTAIMTNTFIKYKGIEFYGTIENASGKSIQETSRRSFWQFGTEIIYRFGENEKFYLGGKHNFVTGTTIGNDEIGIERFNVGAGWFVTRNVLAKIEFVNQRYGGFPARSVFDRAEIKGVMLEAVVSF